MEGFSKRKYLIFRKGFPQEVDIDSVYITSLNKKIRDWGFFKFQNFHVSEIVEYKNIICYVQDGFYDDFKSFYTGRKLLLVEQLKSDSSNIELEQYTSVEMNLEKIIMSNGNSYITIV